MQSVYNITRTGLSTVLFILLVQDTLQYELCRVLLKIESNHTSLVLPYPTAAVPLCDRPL